MFIIIRFARILHTSLINNGIAIGGTKVPLNVYDTKISSKLDEENEKVDKRRLTT